MEEKERNSDDGMEQSLAAKNPCPRFRKFDLAAAIVGVLLFMIFTIYDLYPVQSQSPPTKAETFRIIGQIEATNYFLLQNKSVSVILTS
jgi:hypothetical protein